MPRPHYILYLSNAGLTPCGIGRHLTNTGQLCAPTAEGFARFETLLQSCPPGSRMTLLADLPDETHQLESLPFTRGKDRHNMLDRRRRHLFGDTPFTLTRSLGRSPEGRRDERILFAALPRPAAITPWLERIAHAGHVLGGIVSVPFLSRHLLPADLNGPRPVLLAHATPAGFRVSCFEKGQPRFSRLTTLTATADLSGNTWQDELRRSADYLINQRILPRDPPTPVLLIHSQALNLPAAADLSTLHPGLSLRIEASMTAATRPLDGLLEILSRHPGQAQFAPRSMLAHHRRLLVAQTIRVAATASILACAGFSMHNLESIRELRQQKDASLSQSRELETRITALRQTLPAMPRPLAQLEPDLATLKALQQAPMSPEADLRRLADTLSGNPAIQLEALDWLRHPPTGEKIAGAPESRILELKLARPSSDTAEGLKPVPLMSLLRALRQWPGTEVLYESQAMAVPPSGLPGAEAATGRNVPPDHVTIQVRWRPSQ